MQNQLGGIFKMLLSIIVPLYNTGKFVSQALHSIQNQTFTDFECIIVDDGSTDQSVQVAQTFTQHDARFKLFLNPHQGLAATLNTALHHVHGNYITFCDSDDYLEADAYQNLQPLIQKNPDLIMSNLYFEKNNHSIQNSNYKFHDLQGAAEIIRSFPLIYRQQLMYYNTNKIYRRNLIDKLSFNDLTVGLDTIFNYQIFAQCKTILFNRDPYYHYLQRKGSLVNHFDPQRLAIREKETHALINLLHQWHADYAEQLLNEEWFNTLINVVTNIYAPLPNGKTLTQGARLNRIKTTLTYCLPQINFDCLNSSQASLIHQIQQCVRENNDTVLFQQYSI